MRVRVIFSDFSMSSSRPSSWVRLATAAFNPGGTLEMMSLALWIKEESYSYYSWYGKPGNCNRGLIEEHRINFIPIQYVTL